MNRTWVWVVFLLAFCGVGLGLHGLRWDEDLEFAQIITGRVPYPAAHPMSIYAHNTFSIQVWLAALQLWLVPDDVALSATRNYLALAFGLIPFFALTAYLCASRLAGLAATAVLALGVFDLFNGYAALPMWPQEFSNGTVGRGWMLLVMLALLSGRLRIGYFLLGAMPCVHLGHFPLAFVMGGLVVLGLLYRRNWAALRSAAIWGAAGLGCVVLFYIIRMSWIPAAGDPGPYTGDADPMTVWKYYTVHDVHRMAPGKTVKYLPMHLIMATAVVLSFGAALTEYGARRPFRYGLVFGTVLAGSLVVWFVLAVHSAMGVDTPFLLLGWMPYRIPQQQILALLFALWWALLLEPGRPERERTAGAAVCLFVLAFACSRGLIAAAAPSLYTRYFGEGDFVFFLLSGAAALFIGLRLDGAARLAWGALALASVSALGAFHQFGAACAVAGAGLAALSLRMPIGNVWLARTTAAVCALALCTALTTQWLHREPIRRHPFDSQIAALLAERGEGDAMLHCGGYEPYAQARLGHPVLVHWQTAGYVTYMPELGPALQTLYGELYGIPFGVSENDGHEDQPYTWQPVWSARTPEEWRALSRKYNFRYVWAPAWLPLSLPTAIADDDYKLAEIAPS